MFGASEAAWPLVRADLDLSYAELGLLFAVPDLVAAVVEPAVFVLGDVWRRRVLVLGGGIAFATALALIAGSTTFAMLLVGFALLFPASGAFVSLSQATLMDADPGERERNMTRWTIAGSIGALAGPFLLAGVVFAGGGWRGTYALLAVGALAAVAVAARAPFPRPAERKAPRVRDVLATLRNREALRWLLAVEAADLLLDVLLGFLAVYFVDELRASNRVGAGVVALWMGAGLVGGVAVLRLLARVSGLRYVRASAWLSAALFAGFLLVPGVLPKLALLAALAFVNAGWYPVLQARLYAALPETSGVALALGSVTALPASLVPLAVGVVADRFGLGAALWLLAAAPLFLLALVPRREDR